MPTFRMVALIAVLAALPFVACSNNPVTTGGGGPAAPATTAINVVNKDTFPYEIKLTPVPTGTSSGIYAVAASSTTVVQAAIGASALPAGAYVVTVGDLTLTPPIVAGTATVTLKADGKDTITIDAKFDSHGKFLGLSITYSHP